MPEKRISRVLIIALGLAVAVIVSVLIFPPRGHPARKRPNLTPAAEARSESQPQILAQYAGSKSCKECHEEEFNQWTGSNHQLAERAFDSSRDGLAFNPPRSLGRGTNAAVAFLTNGAPAIRALGLSGKSEIHEIARVIGNDPLRQFLVGGAGGRLQAFDVAYDPHSNDWFNVFGSEDRHPGEWGHWTGRGLTWNFMCASCHNTRLFRNYDAATDSYHTTMAELSVGCEACHGPMAGHSKWQREYGNKNTVDPTLKHLSAAQTIDNCGYCHARRTELTTDWRPGEEFLNHMDPVIVDHSDAYYADGQIHGEDYEYSSFLSSKMHDKGVNCMDCHNPHTGKTKLPGNWLCLRCHDGSRTDAPKINPVTHSHHLVYAFDSKGIATNFDLLAYKPKAIKETGGECVNCHMPQTAYMQRHGRHDHGFTIPDPLLTKEFGIPNACNRCHKDKDSDWALRSCESWYGDKMKRPTRERAEVFARAQRGDSEARSQLLARVGTETSPYWLAATYSLLETWSGMPDVTSALVAATEHTNALVRSVACRSLEQALEAGLPRAREALEKRLTDPIRSVRVAAAFSLRSTIAPSSAAGRDLEAFFAANADEPAGQLQRGMYDFARNDLPAALARFRKAADWDPSSAAIRQELAVVLSAMNRPQEAVEVLKEAVKLAPDDPESHYRLGLALNEAADTKGATAELEKVVKLEPRHARGWYNLGLAQNAAGEQDIALQSLARAESISPDDSRIPYARATILARLGRAAEARLAAERAVELSPNDPESRNLLRMLSE
jgi:predicted CXXCH cytochrome family protein